MKRLFPFFSLLLLLSCNDDKEQIFSHQIKPVSPKFNFGYNVNDFNILHDTIASGDTFGGILAKQNLTPVQIHEIIQKIKDTFDVRLIRKGKPYVMLRTLDKMHKLQAFIYEPDKLNYYIVDFRDSVSVTKKTKPVTIKRRTIAGALDGSLAEALEKENVEAELATKISKIYQWSIDFFKLKKGDKFGVTFTERFVNDTVYDGIDSLEAAFFEYKGKTIYAFPFSPNSTSGKIEYYDQDGKPLKNFFLKAPLKFSRISSKFSGSRLHPVQMIWKAHKGTDYAAAAGTPIMTTAAGVVEKTGYTAGNGNFVKVRHNNKYSTQYLHMSKILVRRGQHVNQGQVIGKVGSTGLATGPHVCYRFWVNGVQMDALRLKLPNAEPMSNKLKPRFLAQMQPLKRELDSIAGLKFTK
ncbi:MAG TPA: peptidoglycan DD-metalloendopeptidase family protein [Flavobacterium sp.]